MPEMKNLKAVCEEFKNLTSQDEIGEEELYVGYQSEFSMEEIADIEEKIFIHGGVIFYTGNLSDIHQFAVGDLTRDLDKAMNRSLGQSVEIFPGLQNTYYVNEFGCHARCKKIPDIAVIMSRRLSLKSIGESNFLMPVEIAYKNESLFQLLIEGFSWINQHQPYAYSALLVKICPNEKAIRVIVVNKRESGGPPSPDMLVISQACPSGILPNPKWRPLTEKTIIEDYFKKTLAFDRIFLADELRDILSTEPYEILIPIQIFNPVTFQVQPVYIDIFHFLQNCALSLLE